VRRKAKSIAAAQCCGEPTAARYVLTTTNEMVTILDEESFDRPTDVIDHVIGRDVTTERQMPACAQRQLPSMKF